MRLPVVAAVIVAAPLAAAAGLAVLALRVLRSERSAARAVAVASDIPAVRRGGPAEALVVFGATVDENGPCNELVYRLDHAADLWRLGVAPVILVSGGVAANIDETTGMAKYLLETGLPASAIAGLRPGESTRATLAAIAERGFRRVVAVSTPYHALRIETEAARHGLDLTVSGPAETPETRHRPTYRARVLAEVGGVVWYAMPTAVTTHVWTGSGSLRHIAPMVLAGQLPPSALLRAAADTVRGRPEGATR